LSLEEIILTTMGKNSAFEKMQITKKKKVKNAAHQKTADQRERGPGVDLS